VRSIRLDLGNISDALEEAARVLKAGGLVAYPTESFYALGADALNADAVNRVFEAKGRPALKPLPVILHDKALIPLYTKEISHAGLLAIERLMPGPITLVFLASDALQAALTAGTSKVGIRVPEHAVAAGLARALGGPVIATSANLSGQPGPTGPVSVTEALGPSIDLLLDMGATPGPPPSTLLDVTENPPVILRPGRVEKAAIVDALGRVNP
jgi:L-threonylcarbamoyladenylate synthase